MRERRSFWLELINHKGYVMSILKFPKRRRKGRGREQIDEICYKISVRIVLEKDEDKYCATAPALPGLIIDGDTLEQVKSRVENGIVVYLMALAKNGDPLPVGPHLTIELHRKANMGFSRFGNPEPYSGSSDWTTMPWPTQELLAAN